MTQEINFNKFNADEIYVICNVDIYATSHPIALKVESKIGGFENHKKLICTFDNSFNGTIILVNRTILTMYKKSFISIKTKLVEYVNGEVIYTGQENTFDSIEEFNEYIKKCRENYVGLRNVLEGEIL